MAVTHDEHYYARFGLTATFLIAALAILGFVLLTIQQTEEIKQKLAKQALPPQPIALEQPSVAAQSLQQGGL